MNETAHSIQAKDAHMNETAHSIQAKDAHMNETKTYPDGSQRVGCPPFPEISPLEEAQGKKPTEPEPAKRGRKPQHKDE